VSITLPTTITAANVLGGIAEPIAIIRAPQADNAEVVDTIDFETGNLKPPPTVRYNPDRILRNFTKRNGTLVYEFEWRAQIIFNLPYLTAAEAVKWGKLYNYYLAGYRCFMRPHNDNSLTLEWQVCPTPGSKFELGFFEQMYVGHTAEFDWTSITTQSNIDLRTSATRHRPVHT